MKFKNPILIILIFWGCEPQLPPYTVPLIPFDDFTINLSLARYNDISIEGRAMPIEGGVRGIILYHGENNNYIAYERNCSYQPEDACATVSIDQTQLFMTDACCGSSFSFTSGDPIAGPAFYPLRRYRTSLDGNLLTITDEPIDF